MWSYTRFSSSLLYDYRYIHVTCLWRINLFQMWAHLFTYLNICVSIFHTQTHTFTNFFHIYQTHQIINTLRGMIDVLFILFFKCHKWFNDRIFRICIFFFASFDFIPIFIYLFQDDLISWRHLINWVKAHRLMWINIQFIPLNFFYD